MLYLHSSTTVVVVVIVVVVVGYLVVSSFRVLYYLPIYLSIYLPIYLHMCMHTHIFSLLLGPPDTTNLERKIK
jgi:hypothetical protein